MEKKIDGNLSLDMLQFNIHYPIPFICISSEGVATAEMRGDLEASSDP